MNHKYTITIDSGTSNTRAFLWNHKRQIVINAAEHVGVRNTAIDGNNRKLKAAIRNCIQNLLRAAGLEIEDIEMIIASGMLTSNVGLAEIPHLAVPVELKDSAAHIRKVFLEDVCEKPIWLIPGVKNTSAHINYDNFEIMDIMRGEEVESFALIDKFFNGLPMLLILPGSHHKYVSVDDKGAITGCLTTLTGELLHSLTNDTIVADSVDKKFVSEALYNKEMVIKGYQTAREVGLGRASFSARILDLFTPEKKSDIANYLLGVVLSTDIQAIKRSEAIQVSKGSKVIIAGNVVVRQAIHDILEYDDYFDDVVVFENPDNIPLSAQGAYLVADKAKLS